MNIALDATYSVGRNLSGIGVYSRRLMDGLAARHPEQRFTFCYRPHRFFRSLGDSFPANVHRRLYLGTPRGDLFHALNQRLEGRARHTVATFHDLFVLTEEYSSVEFRRRFEAQARQAARLADRIIAVSEFTASQVRQLLNVDPANIRVVPHGTDFPASVPPDEARENIVLFVGAIQKRKNVARLIQAFERMPVEWRLMLAGAPEGYGAAAELRAARRVEVLGYVSAEELAALYRRARIFAFPSLDEGFGMPVLEAMAAGVPVITSKCSALPEVAGDAAVLVDPLETGAIEDALIRLASDAELRTGLAERGRERARQFSWQAAVERTWKVYDELVRER